MAVTKYIEHLKKHNGVLEGLNFESIIFDLEDFEGELPYIITFSKCTFVKFFSLINFESNLKKIKFEDCTFSEECKAYFDNICIHTITITNSKFHEVIFSKITAFEITIDSIYAEDLSFGDCTLQYLTIKNLGYSTKSLGIKTIDIESENIFEINIDSKITLDFLRLSDFKRAFINGFFNHISFVANSFDSVNFSSVLTTIDNKDEYSGRINNLSITNMSLTGQFLITYQEIDELNMYSTFIKGGTFNINSTEIGSISIIDSVLNNSGFNTVTFKSYVELRRSDISSIKLTNVKWLDQLRISNSKLSVRIPILYKLMTLKLLTKKRLNFNSNWISNLKEERDTYRQLKAASFANQNNIEALAFYRNEMRLYWKEIRINGGVGLQDRILVFLNRWVSDFGQSWLLPLMWLAIFHTLLYFWIIDFNFTFDWNAFKAGGGQFFELLNPVHKTPDYIKGFYIGVELLMRILDGFFIYHFIRATRKFAKI